MDGVCCTTLLESNCAGGQSWYWLDGCSPHTERNARERTTVAEIVVWEMEDEGWHYGISGTLIKIPPKRSP